MYKREHFGIGNSTTVNINAKQNSDFKNNMNITDEQITNATNKFVNDIKSDIQIDNNVTNDLSILADNIIDIVNVSCRNISLGNITQDNLVQLKMNNTITNKTEQVIESAVENSVVRNIEKNTPKNLINDVLNAQQKAMESFYKGSAIDMGELAKAAGKAAASASSPGIGNSTSVNMNMEKNVAVDNALGITNKQISNISDETENTMMSTIKNNNNVDISNAINVENKIRLANVSACDSLTIDNVKQGNSIEADIQNYVNNVSNSKISQTFKSSINNTFKKLYGDMKEENDAGPGANSRYTSDPDEFAQGMQARLNNLEAVELALWEAVAGSDPDIKEKIRKRYTELGTSIPPEFSGVLDSTPSTNTNTNDSDANITTPDTPDTTVYDPPEPPEPPKPSNLDDNDLSPAPYSAVSEKFSFNDLLEKIKEPPGLYIAIGFGVLLILLILGIIFKLFSRGNSREYNTKYDNYYSDKYDNKYDNYYNDYDYDYEYDDYD